jgi:hypothetical protein
MTREWKSGDVAVSSSGVRWFRQDSGNWISDEGQVLTFFLSSGPRPLVVLDPENDDDMQRLADALRSHDRLTWDGMARDALRSLLTPPPPPIEEPTGLGAVVLDDKGRKWVRTQAEFSAWTRGKGADVSWDRFKPVEILSHGWSHDKADLPASEG